jgi:hypothetical protein
VCVTRGRTLFLLKFSLRDDDDEFLYGDSQLKVPADLALAAPAVPSSSAGENTSSPRTCILLRRVLYPTRPQTKYKFDIFGLLLFSLRARRQPQPQHRHRHQSQSQRQLNRMSEFHQTNCFNRTVHTPLIFFRLASRLARQSRPMTTCSRLSDLLLRT